MYEHKFLETEYTQFDGIKHAIDWDVEIQILQNVKEKSAKFIWNKFDKYKSMTIESSKRC